jgi:hypothetical protein
MRSEKTGLPGVRVTWAVAMTGTLFFVLCRGRWVDAEINVVNPQYDDERWFTAHVWNI